MEALTNWLMANLDIPAIVLFIILGMGAWVLWITQRNPENNFDFSEMLRSHDTGKPSRYAMAMFVSLATTSWLIMYHTIKTNGKVDLYLVLGYAVIWSGVKIVEDAVKAWLNRGAPKAPPSDGTN